MNSLHILTTVVYVCDIHIEVEILYLHISTHSFTNLVLKLHILCTHYTLGGHKVLIYTVHD